MLWNKVGYTNIQREKSLKIRKIKATLKRNRIHTIVTSNQKIFTKRGMSLNRIIHAIVSEYKASYNESISYSTVRNYLIKYYKNKVFYIRAHKNISKSIKIKNYSAFTHSHNNKLKTIQRESAFKTRKRVITLIRLVYEDLNTLKNVV